MGGDVVRNYPLGKITEIIRGITFSKEEGTSKPEDGKLPVIRAGSIQKSLLLEKDQIWIPAKKIKQHQFIKKNDIVMCGSSGSSDLVGKCAKSEQDWNGSFGAFCVGIRADETKCDSSYLYHFLCSPNFRNWTKASSEGANIKNIRASELAAFEIPLPPLSEQKRIAAILDKADSLRRKRQQAMQLADEFLRAVFLDMFGDPVTNPKGWKKSSITAIADVITGHAFKSAEFIEDCDDAVRLCRGTNTLTGYFDWSDTAYWSKEKISKLENYLIEEGDVILAMDRPWISSGLKVCIAELMERETYLVQRVARLRPIKLIYSDFIYSCIKSKSFESHCRPTETTVPHISPVELKNFQIMLPDEALVKKYHEITLRVRKLIRNMKISDFETDRNFNSLSKKAFAGEL